MDTNEVYTILDNRSLIGGSYMGGLIWPRSDPNALFYITGMGLLIGGEVIDVHGDTLHIIDDGFPLGLGDHEPVTFNPWGWLPLSRKKEKIGMSN